MNDEQLYEDWKRRRGRPEVPPDFADRVMDAVDAQPAAGRGWPFPSTLLWSLLSSRTGQVAACTLAAACCVFRLLHVVAIFIAH